MHFEEISEVVPYLELAADQGQTLESPQRGEPRAYKTHAWKGYCPTGARYVVVVRDPADVAVSFFKVPCDQPCAREFDADNCSASSSRDGFSSLVKYS